MCKTIFSNALITLTSLCADKLEYMPLEKFYYRASQSNQLYPKLEM